MHASLLGQSLGIEIGWCDAGRSWTREPDGEFGATGPSGSGKKSCPESIQVEADCQIGSLPVNQTVPEFEKIVAWGVSRNSRRTQGGDWISLRFRFACSNPGSILSTSSKSLRASSS